MEPIQGQVTRLNELAGCKKCDGGVLVPFHTPDGYVIYFCNNCRARFSGYANEPLLDGSPAFMGYAVYSEPSKEVGVPEEELKARYEELLGTFPPERRVEGGCLYCGSQIPEGSTYCSECWLPVP